MALSEARQRQLLDRYMARQRRLTEAGGRAMEAAWAQLTTFGEADIAALREFGLQTTTIVSQRGAALSSAYLSNVLETPVTAALEVVEPDWRGPFTHMWGAIGRGESVEQAIAAGSSRARAAGEQAVSSTIRRVGDQAPPDLVSGWKRVPNADACEWCLAVSARTFGSATAADIGHDHCYCGVTPIPR